MTQASRVTTTHTRSDTTIGTSSSRCKRSWHRKVIHTVARTGVWSLAMRGVTTFPSQMTPTNIVSASTTAKFTDPCSDGWTSALISASLSLHVTSRLCSHRSSAMRRPNLMEHGLCGAAVRTAEHRTVFFIRWASTDVSWRGRTSHTPIINQRLTIVGMYQ